MDSTKIATLRRTEFFLVTVTASPTPTIAAMSHGTWNLKHLGWDNGKRLDVVADVAKGADLWALDEVMDDSAVTQLEHELERQTSEEWSSMALHAVGRSSYRESYAYLWRDSAVEYTKGAVVYLDPGDLFAREPYLVEFRHKNTDEGDDGLDPHRRSPRAVATLRLALELSSTLRLLTIALG